MDKLTSQPEIIKGTIGQLGLQDWWLSAFTESERNYIVQTYKPFTTGGDVSGETLIKGDGDYNPNAVSSLSGLATWFKKDIKRTLTIQLGLE